MAVTRKQLKPKQESNNNSSERKKRTQQETTTVQRQDALHTRRAANTNPKEIAAMLSQKALAGDLESAKLFVKLKDQEKSTQPVVKKRTGLTCAQQLALCPPWQGDLDEDFFDADDADVPEPDPVRT